MTSRSLIMEIQNLFMGSSKKAEPNPIIEGEEKGLYFNDFLNGLKKGALSDNNADGKAALHTVPDDDKVNVVPEEGGEGGRPEVSLSKEADPGVLPADGKAALYTVPLEGNVSAVLGEGGGESGSEVAVSTESWPGALSVEGRAATPTVITDSKESVPTAGSGDVEKLAVAVKSNSLATDSSNEPLDNNITSEGNKEITSSETGTAVKNNMERSGSNTYPIGDERVKNNSSFNGQNKDHSLREGFIVSREVEGKEPVLTGNGKYSSPAVLEEVPISAHDKQGPGILNASLNGSTQVAKETLEVKTLGNSVPDETALNTLKEKVDVKSEDSSEKTILKDQFVDALREAQVRDGQYSQ